jgi:hypothetical protein
METKFNKTAILMLKKDIKEMAEMQKVLKNQRKTINLVGERQLSPSEATWKHALHREKLRRMYLAYGLLRNRDLCDIDRNYEDVGGYLKIAEEYEKKAMNIVPEKVE